MADIEGLVSRLQTMPFEERAATHLGQLRAELYRIGRPIGPDNMMIAGHAGAPGLILVTNITKELERVPGLRITNWA